MWRTMGIAAAASIIGAVLGGLAVVGFLSWGQSLTGQPVSNPARSDYVDLLLTLSAILMAAVGLAVTVGAVVIGAISLVTTRRIKVDAIGEAKQVAKSVVVQIMPEVVAHELKESEILRRTLQEMALRGELNMVIDAVTQRNIGPASDRLEPGGADEDWTDG